MIPLIFLAIIVCWYWGGQRGGRIRDVLCPILMSLGIGLLTKNLWLTVVNLGLWQIIRLGYGNYSPQDDPKPSFLAHLTHDRNGWWIRALYGLIVATMIGLALRIGSFLPIWVYITYITGNSLIGFCVSRFRLPVLIADICVSAGLGSILFLIR